MTAKKSDAKDYSTMKVEELVKELQSIQKEASDNMELANLAERKSTDLQSKLNEAESNLSANDTVISGLKVQLQGAISDSESKASEIETLKGELQNALSAVASKDSEIELLKGKLTAIESKSVPDKITFDCNGKKYEVIGPVKIPGHQEAYTAIEIASDETLQAILVERNSGMIREIK